MPLELPRHKVPDLDLCACTPKTREILQVACQDALEFLDSVFTPAWTDAGYESVEFFYVNFPDNMVNAT